MDPVEDIQFMFRDVCTLVKAVTTWEVEALR